MTIKKQDNLNKKRYEIDVLKKLSLFFHTIKHLKWQQIFHRILRIFPKKIALEKYEEGIHKRSPSWLYIELYPEKIDTGLNANFLNSSKKLKLPSDWNNSTFDKLWLYNLHYFEDLIAVNSNQKHDFHNELLKSWVKNNEIGYGIGWEPYPTSLRITNVLKAWLGGLNLDGMLLKNIFFQASYLSKNLEKHLLGNHYFVNLKALLFAGVIFENLRWLSIAEKQLLKEIPEQILEDGAHFELSPMYHSMILVDMLDIYNLSKAYPTRVSNKLVSLLENYIPKMLLFMEAMAHPDEDVSFFNDSVKGIAPDKVIIESYAKKLGFKINHLNLSENQIIDNDKSGYISATSAGNKLIFDASSVGPDYNPGHAHADTLSFEFSIGSERVFVNSGISEYADGHIRHNQRKTKAHNTIEVDGKDSSEVWSAFRVARRAYIVKRNCEINEEHQIKISSSHNGFVRNFNNCIHSRTLVLSSNELSIKDEIEGSYSSAFSYLHFHPDMSISLDKNILIIKGFKFLLSCNLDRMPAVLLDSEWHPEFGVIEKNKVLKIKYEKPCIQLQFKWSKI